MPLTRQTIDSIFNPNKTAEAILTEWGDINDTDDALHKTVIYWSEQKNRYDVMLEVLRRTDVDLSQDTLFKADVVAFFDAGDFYRLIDRIVESEDTEVLQKLFFHVVSQGVCEPEYILLELMHAATERARKMETDRLVGKSIKLIDYLYKRNPNVMQWSNEIIRSLDALLSAERHFAYFEWFFKQDFISQEFLMGGPGRLVFKLLLERRGKEEYYDRTKLYFSAVFQKTQDPKQAFEFLNARLEKYFGEGEIPTSILEAFYEEMQKAFFQKNQNPKQAFEFLNTRLEKYFGKGEIPTTILETLSEEIQKALVAVINNPEVAGETAAKVIDFIESTIALLPESIREQTKLFVQLKCAEYFGDAGTFVGCCKAILYKAKEYSKEIWDSVKCSMAHMLAEGELSPKDVVELFALTLLADNSHSDAPHFLQMIRKQAAGQPLGLTFWQRPTSGMTITSEPKADSSETKTAPKFIS